MLYAVLIYDAEDVIGAMPKAEFDQLIANHERIQEKLAADGRLGPVVRLMPTTVATTLRQGAESIILDGPFAETKEQLLGFYIVECESLEEAHEAAQEIVAACGARALEVRPVHLFHPGVGLT